MDNVKMKFSCETSREKKKKIEDMKTTFSCKTSLKIWKWKMFKPQKLQYEDVRNKFSLVVVVVTVVVVTVVVVTVVVDSGGGDVIKIVLAVASGGGTSNASARKIWISGKFVWLRCIWKCQEALEVHRFVWLAKF